MDLIAVSQTVHSQLKSVTGKIMEDCLSFNRLRAYTWKTLGRY